MRDSIETVVKMAVPTTAGVVASLSDVELLLRIASISLTITLSIIVFVRAEKRRRDEKKNG